MTMKLGTPSKDSSALTNCIIPAAGLMVLRILIMLTRGDGDVKGVDHNDDNKVVIWLCKLTIIQHLESMTKKIHFFRLENWSLL